MNKAPFYIMFYANFYYFEKITMKELRHVTYVSLLLFLLQFYYAFYAAIFEEPLSDRNIRKYMKRGKYIIL